MSNCQDRPTVFPEALWKALMNLPALRYMKAPVDTVAQLYEKYPIGNEKGTFAFVHNENTFYTYHPRGWHRGEWLSISTDGISSFFEIDAEFLRERDILVYDNNTKKFIVKSGNVWNNLLDKASSFIQVNRFFNEVDEIPTIDSDQGIYFVHKNTEVEGATVEFRALYLVLDTIIGKKVIKIWNSSDYYTASETQKKLDKKANQTQVDDIAASVDTLAVTKAEKSVVDALMNGIIKQPAVDTYNDTSGGKTSLLNTYPNPQVGWDVFVREENTRYNWNGTQWVNMETEVYDNDTVRKEDLLKIQSQLNFTPAFDMLTANQQINGTVNTLWCNDYWAKTVLGIYLKAREGTLYIYKLNINTKVKTLIKEAEMLASQEGKMATVLFDEAVSLEEYERIGINGYLYFRSVSRTDASSLFPNMYTLTPSGNIDYQTDATMAYALLTPERDRVQVLSNRVENIKTDINKLNPKRHFSLFNNSEIITSNDSFFITEVMYRFDPSGYAFLKNQTVAVGSGYDCVIADFDNVTNALAQIYSGKELFPDKQWWQITSSDLTTNKFIIATKGNDGKWSSPFAPIQSLIDKQYINEDINSSVNALEKKLNGLYTYESFVHGLYVATGTNINVGDIVRLGYTSASDAYTIKVPIEANTAVSIYTYQGAFNPPAFIVDDNNVVLEVFGVKGSYLDSPLKITTSHSGYLIVNAHEIISANVPKLKIVHGIADIENRVSIIEQEIGSDFTTVEKIVKKGGTVGVDCDFTDIKEAVNSITDNSSSNRYIIHVLDGVYDYSDNGDTIGVRLKNYVTLHCQSKNVRIIKRDSAFNWGKATIDVANETIEYTAIKGTATVISNNCKCPVHIDSPKFIGLFEGENLDLINEQPIGTGDNPSEGQANCLAVGWRGNEHFKLSNIRANGKIWGHNYANTKSKGLFELIGANCRTIQIGDLTSYGNDKVVLKGCKADLYEHLWFSEFTGNRAYQQQSFSFELVGNNIAQSIVADHAGTHDALTEYFNGVYPFSISNLHKIMNGIGITVGSLVKQTGINTVSKWQAGDKLFGVALENSNSNGRILIQYSGIASMKADGTVAISFNDELEINTLGNVVKRTTGILIGYAMQSMNSVGVMNVKLK